MSDPLGVVVVGSGAFARTHAEAIRRRTDARLIGFLGRVAGSASSLGEAYSVEVFDELDVAGAHSGVQAAVLATPHATHAELAIRFLRKGVSVLVEKPLALTIADCDAIADAEASADGVCMVGHLMKYSPAHIHARELILAGAIGDPVFAEGRRIIPWDAALRRPWQLNAVAGGGMWWIQGVHVIDQLSWLLGDRATAAQGVAELRFQDPAIQDADDFGIARLRYAKAEASITIAGTVGGTSQVWSEVLGTTGRLQVSHHGRVAVDLGAGWQEHPFIPAIDHWQATLDGEWDAFVEAVDRGSAGDRGVDYGRYVVAVVEAIRTSAATGESAQIR